MWMETKAPYGSDAKGMQAFVQRGVTSVGRWVALGCCWEAWRQLTPFLLRWDKYVGT